jgi:hypothetical protein
VAPNVGIAWRPNVQSGWLRQVLGDPEIATINGGFTRSFNRERLDRFLDIYNGNPGQTVPATRSSSSTAFPLVLPGESWPVLYSQTSRLGAPAFQTTPQFPLPAAFGNGAWIFDLKIEIPYTDSWNVSFQRAITKDMVGEIRYVGNTNRFAWTLENWNAINVYETGWLNGEFELAQQNLRANLAAGLGGTFAYTGAPGMSPLSILLAHFNGLFNAGMPRAGCGADNRTPNPYCGNVWTNSSFTGDLDPFFPDPYGFASNLYLATISSTSLVTGVNTRFFTNAMNLNYPRNYWVLNDQLDEVQVRRNSDNKPYTHQVIMQLRRRLAQGLQAQVGYTWQRNFSGSLEDFHLPRFQLRSTGVPHAFQMLFTYDIPVGRGKRFGANMNPWLDGVIGGWSLSGTSRIQRQSFVVRDAVLVGMTLDEAQSLLQDVRFATDPVSGALTVWNFPTDIYTNTRLAFDTDATALTGYSNGGPTGPLAELSPAGNYRYFAPAGGVQADGSICNWIYPGDCGTPELWFSGRWFGEADFRLAKAFQLPGRARFELSAEIFNAFMAKNFPNVVDPNPQTSANTFRITSTQNGARTAQIVWRVTW